MKFLCLLLFVLPLDSFASVVTNCRKIEDPSRMVRVIESHYGATLSVMTEDHSGKITERDVLLAGIEEFSESKTLEAFNVVFQLQYFTTDLDFRIVGDTHGVFAGYFLNGLRNYYHGEYACIENGIIHVANNGKGFVAEQLGN